MNVLKEFKKQPRNIQLAWVNNVAHRYEKNRALDKVFREAPGVGVRHIRKYRKKDKRDVQLEAYSVSRLDKLFEHIAANAWYCNKCQTQKHEAA